jgi:hypothetical protein
MAPIVRNRTDVFSFYVSLKHLTQGGAMQEYRAYLIGPDGHIFQRTDLVCVDDEAAKESAERLVNGHDVELWQLDRKIAMLTHKQ